MNVIGIVIGIVFFSIWTLFASFILYGVFISLKFFIKSSYVYLTEYFKLKNKYSNLNEFDEYIINSKNKKFAGARFFEKIIKDVFGGGTIFFLMINNIIIFTLIYLNGINNFSLYLLQFIQAFILFAYGIIILCKTNYKNLIPTHIIINFILAFPIIFYLLGMMGKSLDSGEKPYHFYNFLILTLLYFINLVTLYYKNKKANDFEGSAYIIFSPLLKLLSAVFIVAIINTFNIIIAFLGVTVFDMITMLLHKICKNTGIQDTVHDNKIIKRKINKSV